MSVPKDSASNLMRICIFTETYYPVMGGGETQTRLLAEGLVKNGHAVIILTRRSDRILPKIERFGAVTVYRLPPVGKGQLKKWGLILSGAVMLLRLHRQYDLIFVSGFRIIGISAVLIGKFLQKFCILKADSQGEMSGEFFTGGLNKLGISRQALPFRLFLSLRNLILKKADAFSAISTDIADEVKAQEIPSNKIFAIPNGVDVSRFHPATPDKKKHLRNQLKIPDDAIVAIYTGRLVSYKGLPMLLKVWRDMAQQYKNLLLILAGTGGLDIHNCERELKDFVKTTKLESFVRFTGNVENVPEYLQASDIFTFPSENEAFGGSLIEAMACGLPVITTPMGAIKQIVNDGENGLMVSPGDAGQLHQALDRLMTDPSLRSRLGQAAWETARADFAAEVVTGKYLSLFHGVSSQ